MKTFIEIDSQSTLQIMTRQEIIDTWSKQSEEYLNSYCCPKCRNILIYNKEKDFYICDNGMCEFDHIIKENK